MPGHAYVGARLIDGTGAAPIGDAVMVVDDGVIVAVGEADAVQIPLDAERVDLSGLCVIPGLVDCHTHLGGSHSADYGNWVLEDDRRQAIVSTVQMRQLMTHGVTTIRDISHNGLRLKWAVNNGVMDGPRIIACGPGISRTGGHGDAHHLPVEMVQESHPWAILADGPEEIRKAVRRLNRMGSDAVKVWATGGGMWEKELETDQHFDLDELTALVREANLLKMPVLAHCESLAATKDALRAGVTSIEHGEELDDEAIAMMLDGDVTHVPTLQLFLGPWFDEYPPPPRQGLADYRGETMVEKEKNRCADNFNASRQAGVRIAVGSDSFSSIDVPYGYSTHMEIRTMIEVGMPPMDAIVAATLNGAVLLRVAGQTGSLEVGKQADFIALDGDPLSDSSVFSPERMMVIARGGVTWKDERRAGTSTGSL
jgi:imidazolonepropionase-like amidohydrolase